MTIFFQYKKNTYNNKEEINICEIIHEKNDIFRKTDRYKISIKDNRSTTIFDYYFHKQLNNNQNH